ncbi:MAG: hypothetical protein CL933_22735 [Deltaproteobacteria bacterium]|nr:hypothetical protein [Deltaproteobacteria bacterium]
MSNGALVLIGVVLVVLVGLTRMWRKAEARAVLLEVEKEKLIGERQELSARLSRETQARRKRSDELAAQRKRAEKAKKRNAKGAQDLPLGTASRIGDLEEQIERVERERDRSCAEREELAQQVARLETRVEFSARAVEEASVARREAARAAVPVPDAGVEGLRAELAEKGERAEKLADELRVAKETEARMRKRVSTQEQLYASVRAELDIKKDRLRTQEEQIQRLRALKVAVAD